MDHQVKGQINLKSMHLKPHFFLSRGQTRKQFEGPLRTFVTVVTRSPSDLNNTNNHMSGPMFSCNLHIKYQLLFSYLRKHAKHAVFIIIVHLQNEKPNYNRKKKILVLGKMNLIIIQRGRQQKGQYDTPRPIQYVCIFTLLYITVTSESRHDH